MNEVEDGQAMQEQPAARRRPAVLLGACFIALAAAGPAWAQGSEPRLLIPGGGGATTQSPAAVPPATAVPSSSPPLSGAATAVPAAAPTTARLEVRMSQLEQDLRTVTGRMEDISFQLRKLDDRLDKLAADMEYRLSQAKSGDAATTAAASDAAAVGSGSTAATPRVASAADGDTRPAAAQSTTAPAASELGGQQTASLPPKTPREQYARAFAQLERRQYEDSAAGFSSFLKANPNDPLADNARYWLAETYYARGEYGGSAELFLDAYEKSKTGPKAPDTLLKLGLSLAGLDKNKEACASFRELSRGFPNAPDAIKERAVQESKRLGCG